MSTQIPTAAEKQSAEEAVITEPTAPVELFDKPFIDTLMRTVLQDRDAMDALAIGLFANPTFREFQAIAFSQIYDSFIKMHNKAAAEYTKLYQITIKEASEGNPLEFLFIFAEADRVIFFNIDETGTRVPYLHPEPGVMQLALEALAAVNAVPDVKRVYIGVLVERPIEMRNEFANATGISDADIIAQVEAQALKGIEIPATETVQ